MMLFRREAEEKFVVFALSHCRFKVKTEGRK
jgi:hypothetical protein